MLNRRILLTSAALAPLAGLATLAYGGSKHSRTGRGSSPRSGAIGPCPHDHRTDPSWGLFWDHSSGWKRDLDLPNGRHYSFVDYQALIPWFQRFFAVPPELITNTVGTANVDQVLRAVRTYIPAFFDQHLRHRPYDWSHALPETKFIA
jgi:hypothetical protein